jgi:ABC-2 type transport system permease protein
MFSLVASSYIALSVWLAVLNQQDTVQGYGRTEFIQYYLGVTLVSMLTGAWAGYWVAHQIRVGSLDRHLLRPWDYLHYAIINNIGEKIPKLLILLPMTLLVGWSLQPNWEWTLTGWQLTLLALTIFMGAGIALLINICIGLIGFWTADISGISTFYLAVEALLSGRLVPLNLFPRWLRQLAYLSPFRYTVSLPVEIIVGNQEMDAIWWGIMGQLLWLVASYGLYRFLWHHGSRVYSSSGG